VDRTKSGEGQGRRFGQHPSSFCGVAGSRYRPNVTTATAAKVTRGPNKGAAWRRNPEDGTSVIRLPLDTSDPLMRHRVEDVFQSAFEVRRATQSDARSRVDAYWAAPNERARSPKATRERLGLTRGGLERTAYGHLDASPHLARGCTKAMAMHLADSVWTSVERHLFADSSGRRAGRPKVGRWFDFTRIPGRAKSHTTARKWETFRLHGTLDGHRGAYWHNGRFHQPKTPPSQAAGATKRTSWCSPTRTCHPAPLPPVPKRRPAGQVVAT